MAAIQIEDISKIYRLGEVGTGTLSHDLNRWWRMNILGQDDPMSKVGGTNDRTQRARKGEHVAALRDINLEIQEGEVLGIIGKNGAGKSTLLKILSRVTSPTTGRVRIYGRMASLLEVGTGFHVEMTGRENIYMNGTIMGMRKGEIDRKLEEIVEFSGVAKYLDTPVKRYSSGMTVRLGFAVAAYLEPEILIVDEVLAVGDAEFQKKAIGKMQDVSKNQGRTVLFVSHNMGAVKSLCNKGIVLKNGTIDFTGTIEESVEYYSEDVKKELVTSLHVTDLKRRFYCNKKIEMLYAEMLNDSSIATNEPIRMRFQLRRNQLDVKEVRVIGMLNSRSDGRLGAFISTNIDLSNAPKEVWVEVELRNHNLALGQYFFDFNIGLGDNTSIITDFDLVYDTLSFEVRYDDMASQKSIVKWPSIWGHQCFKDVSIRLVTV